MELQSIPGIGSERARAIRQFKDFSVAEAELRFIEKQGIEALPFDDPRYPQRLSNCYDPPILLFYRGTASLNGRRMLAIIGTRQPSNYGVHLTEQIVQELTQSNIAIVSGLAQGIDAVAHRSAMKQQMQTIGVLAHGLDRIYPHHHRKLANMMCEQGGLLTEFRQLTIPDRYHFPARNRIVAGMTDATLVIESGEKGGSLITAALANQYNRDVYAVPGRTEDTKSKGCLKLIRNHQAEIFISTADLLRSLGWADETQSGRNDFGIPIVAFNEEETKIMNCLKSTDPTPQDVIGWETNLPPSKLSSLLLQLEMKGVVVSLPGKQFRLRS